MDIQWNILHRSSIITSIYATGGINTKSKFKKIGAIIVILITVGASFVAFVNYENANMSKGIYCETGYYGYGASPNNFCMYNIKNFSYLGNSVSIGYVLIPGPISHYVNLSNIVENNIIRGCLIYSILCLNPLTTIHWPYSHPVVTILNTSLSVNNTIFKNGTDKNDNFGPYWAYSELCNSGYSYFHLYEKGDFQQSNKSAYKLPVSSIFNPGNYTFYENITFTISVSMGFMHFTSQPFHFDESWWVVYGYNMTHNGKSCWVEKSWLNIDFLILYFNCYYEIIKIYGLSNLTLVHG